MHTAYVSQHLLSGPHWADKEVVCHSCRKRESRSSPKYLRIWLGRFALPSEGHASDGRDLIPNSTVSVVELYCTKVGRGRRICLLPAWGQKNQTTPKYCTIPGSNNKVGFGNNTLVKYILRHLNSSIVFLCKKIKYVARQHHRYEDRGVRPAHTSLRGARPSSHRGPRQLHSLRDRKRAGQGWTRSASTGRWFTPPEGRRPPREGLATDPDLRLQIHLPPCWPADFVTSPAWPSSSHSPAVH